MSSLLIIMIAVYIAAIIIQIGYFATWRSNNPFGCIPLNIIVIIISIILAPITVLLEIGASLLFAKMNK